MQILDSFVDELEKIATSRRTKEKMRRLEAEGKYTPGRRRYADNRWGHESSRWKKTTGDSVRRRTLRDRVIDDPKWETVATPDPAEAAVGYNRWMRSGGKVPSKDKTQAAARHEARARVLGNKKAQERYHELYARRSGIRDASEDFNRAKLHDLRRSGRVEARPRKKVSFLRRLLS